jgi:hypothetical protein
MTSCTFTFGKQFSCLNLFNLRSFALFHLFPGNCVFPKQEVVSMAVLQKRQSKIIKFYKLC